MTGKRLTWMVAAVLGIGALGVGVPGVGGSIARAEELALPAPEPPAPPRSPRSRSPLRRRPLRRNARSRSRSVASKQPGRRPLRTSPSAPPRTRAVADELDVASLDPLARAALFDPASGASARDRAEAAVLLAPGLPLAHAARARAAWESGSFLDAFEAAGAAIATLPQHLESWLWLGATASVLALFALVAGAVAFLLARGVATARFAAHDFGDLLEASMPSFARIAGVAAIVLVPVAFGEGVAGLALGLFALALCTRAREARIAVAVAVACLLGALYPLGEIAGRRVAAVAAPIRSLLASRAAETGFVDPLDAARLARAGEKSLEADGDPIVAQALAQWERGAGDLAAADARYAALAGPCRRGSRAAQQRRGAEAGARRSGRRHRPVPPRPRIGAVGADLVQPLAGARRAPSTSSSTTARSPPRSRSIRRSCAS